MLYFHRVWKGEVMAWHKYKDGSGEYYRGYNPYTGEFYTDTDRKHRKAAEARAKAAKKRKKAAKREANGCGIGLLYLIGGFAVLGLVVEFVGAVIRFMRDYTQEIFIGECVVAALSLIIGLIWLHRREKK